MYKDYKGSLKTSSKSHISWK